MSLFSLDDPGDLVAPTLLAAFDGWVDAGSAATTALEQLVDDAPVVATFDADAALRLPGPAPAARDRRRPARRAGLARARGPPDARSASATSSCSSGRSPTIDGARSCAARIDLVAHARRRRVDQPRRHPGGRAAHPARADPRHGIRRRACCAPTSPAGPAGILRVPSALVSALEFEVSQAGVPARGLLRPGAALHLRAVSGGVGGPARDARPAPRDRRLPTGDLADEAEQLRTRLDAAAAVEETTRTYVERLESMVDEAAPPGRRRPDRRHRALPARPRWREHLPLIAGARPHACAFVDDALSCIAVSSPDACQSPRQPAAHPPDARWADRGRAGPRARGLGPDRPPRCRGPQRRGRPDLCRPRAARRHPPRRRLSDPADRDDPRRGRGAVPVGDARSRRRARTGNRRRRGPPQGPCGAARPSCARALRGSWSGSTSMPPAGSRPASLSPTSPASPSRSGRSAGPASTTSAATAPSSRVARAARTRAQGRGLVPGGASVRTRSGRTGCRASSAAIVLEERTDRPTRLRPGHLLGRVERGVRARQPRITVLVRVPENRLGRLGDAVGFARRRGRRAARGAGPGLAPAAPRPGWPDEVAGPHARGGLEPRSARACRDP